MYAVRNSGEHLLTVDTWSPGFIAGRSVVHSDRTATLEGCSDVSQSPRSPQPTQHALYPTLPLAAIGRPIFGDDPYKFDREGDT